MPRERRGAVLVLTTLLLTALMMMVAVAVDLSRLDVLRNELQTAADAAALAGAQQLTRDASAASATARSYALANPAFDSLVSVDSIALGQWDPVRRQLTGVSSPSDADAVRVDVHRATRFLFAGIFGTPQPVLHAHAVAWGLAPVATAACGKPWAVPYADIMASLGKSADDSLTAADVRTLADTIDGNKHYINLKLGAGGGGASPGNFYAVDFPPLGNPGGTGHGAGAYADWIPVCTPIKAGDSFQTEPGNMVGPTMNGMEQLCQPLSNGICYNAQGGVGIPIAVPVWRSDGGKKGGRMDITADLVATVMLTNVGESGNSKSQISGFVFAIHGTGPIAPPGSTPSTVVQTILVQ